MHNSGHKPTHKADTPTAGELLLALRRKLAERGQALALRDELSMSQFEVLWFVSGSDAVPMDAIAERLSIKPPSATSLIAALEKKGYIKRMHDRSDRRVVNVVLTASARRQIASLKKSKDRLFESLLSKLSRADRAEFTRLLTILAQD